MTEQAILLWLELFETAARRTGLVGVSATVLCERLAVPFSDLSSAIQPMITAGVVGVLAAEEVAAIASGRRVSGHLVSLDAGDESVILRIADPDAVEAQLRASR